MDSNIVGYIEQLLKKNRSVCLPDLGSVLKRPGSKSEYFFNELMKFDDGALTAHVASKEKCSDEEAKAKVAEFVTAVQSALAEGNPVDFGNLGTVSKGGDGKIALASTEGAAPVGKTPKLMKAPKVKAKVSKGKKETDPEALKAVEAQIAAEAEERQKADQEAIAKKQAEEAEARQLAADEEKAKKEAEKEAKAAEKEAEKQRKEEEKAAKAAEKEAEKKRKEEEKAAKAAEKEAEKQRKAEEKEAKKKAGEEAKGVAATADVEEPADPKEEAPAVEEVAKLEAETETESKEAEEEKEDKKGAKVGAVAAALTADAVPAKEEDTKDPEPAEESKAEEPAVEEPAAEEKETELSPADVAIAAQPEYEFELASQTPEEAIAADLEEQYSKRDEKITQRALLVTVIIVIILGGGAATWSVFNWNKVQDMFSWAYKGDGTEQLEVVSEEAPMEKTSEAEETTDEDSGSEEEESMESADEEEDLAAVEEMTSEESMEAEEEEMEEEEVVEEPAPKTTPRKNTSSGSSVSTSMPSNVTGGKAVNTSSSADADFQYHIIAGCFANQDNADRLVKTLKDKGYEARNLGKIGGLFNVAFESYGDKNEAYSAARKISSDNETKAWVLYLRQ